MDIRKRNNIEAVLLSNLIKSNENRLTILKAIDTPEFVFNTKQGVSIFQEVQYLQDDLKEVDVETINSKNPSIGLDFLKKLVSEYDIVDKTNISYYIDSLRKEALNRDFIKKISVDLQDKLISHDVSLEDKVKYVADIQKEISDRVLAKEDPLKDMTSMVIEYKEVLGQRRIGKSYYTTGDRRLDKILPYGFAPSELTIIAGRPNNGKSLLSLHLAKLLSRAGIPTNIYNLEMNNTGTMDRLFSMETHINPLKYIKQIKDLTAEQYDELISKVDILSKYNLKISDKTNLGLDDLRKLIQEEQIRNGSEYMVIFIDLFTKLNEFKHATGTYDIEQICNKTQAMIKDLKVHAVLDLQINRESDKITLKEVDDIKKIYPTFSNIKNSGAFEEIADQILLVSSPTLYLHRHDWGKYVPHHLRVEVGKIRGVGSETRERSFLYKQVSEYVSLIEPDNDDWDPLEVQFDEDEIEGYVRNNYAEKRC